MSKKEVFNAAKALAEEGNEFMGKFGQTTDTGGGSNFVDDIAASLSHFLACTTEPVIYCNQEVTLV